MVVWRVRDTRARRIACSIAVAVLAMSAVTIPTATSAGAGPTTTVVPRFSDVPLGHPFYADIEWMASSGVADGFPDGTFRPNDPVSRRAMAAFLYREAGRPDGTTPACVEAPFPDVPLEAPFCGEIAWLKAQSLATGYPDGGFHPVAPVTRLAAAAFLYRYAHAPKGATPSCMAAPFTDVAVGSALCGEVAWAKGEGVTTGYPDGSFHPGIAVTRQAVAAFVHRRDQKVHEPVRLGGSRNFLGTSDLFGFGLIPENFYLSTAGYCSRHEFGDLIAGVSDNNAGTDPPFSCLPASAGGPAYVRENPSYDPNGYVYAIDIPAGAAGAYDVDVYDAPACRSVSGSHSTGAEQPFGDFDFVVRDRNSSDPLFARVLSTTRMTPADCATAQGVWTTLPMIEAQPGTYYLQVRPVVPTSRTVDTPNNQYAVRAHHGAFGPCSSDPTVAGNGVELSATCPTVRSLVHLPMYASLAGVTPSFILGSIGADRAGQTLQVDLFDGAERSRFVELLDPNNNPVTVTAEIACGDETFNHGTACPAEEVAPTSNGGPAYGPWVTDKFDLCGPITAAYGCGADAENTGDLTHAAQQVWGFAHLTGRTQYNNRTVRLSTVIPANAAALYGGKTAWRIRYTVAATPTADRTTWTARTVPT